MTSMRVTRRWVAAGAVSVALHALLSAVALRGSDRPRLQAEREPIAVDVTWADEASEPDRPAEQPTAKPSARASHESEMSSTAKAISALSPLGTTAVPAPSNRANPIDLALRSL